MKFKLLLALAALSGVGFAFGETSKPAASDKPAAEKKETAPDSCGECCEAAVKTTDAKGDGSKPAAPVAAAETKK